MEPFLNSHLSNIPIPESYVPAIYGDAVLGPKRWTPWSKKVIRR